MADVTLTYKGNTIAELSATGNKTLKTAGKYCEADIELAYVKSGGVGEADYRKAVKFFDYDGTLVYSFTADEFLALTAMPTNPYHAGLTAQGWNWTLSDAQDYVAECGFLIIGQHYIPSDGKTRLYIQLDGSNVNPYLGLCVNGTVDVDWGDGSSHSTVTGTNTNTIIYTLHQYQSPGEYVIAISPSSGTTVGIRGTTPDGSYILTENKNVTSSIYRNSLQAVEIGSGIKFIDYAFRNCRNIKSVSIPITFTDNWNDDSFLGCWELLFVTLPDGVNLGGSTFYDCVNLRYISFPKSVTYNSNTKHQLYNCVLLTEVSFSRTNQPTKLMPYCSYDLKKIAIPEGVTNIPSSFISNVRMLYTLTIPSSVTAIESDAFLNCDKLREIHFKRTTPPTVSSGAFSSTLGSGSNLDPVCKIYVPYSNDHSVLAAYMSASNYPSSSTYAYIEE